MKKIFLIFTGLIAIITLAILASSQLALGAPSVFISNPSTSTPSTNFSFTVGTSTPLSAFGSTTLAVYGSTTIQTPVNTIHAFRIINSASSTIFEVDTANSSTTISTALNVNTLTVGSCTGCASLSGGVTNAFAIWSSASTLTASTSALTFDYFHSTTTATSTMQGPLSVPDLMIKRLTGYDITATSSLTVSTLTSALTLTGSGGLFAEYAGTSCTNQFVRSLSALGAATCATVVAGDVDLADLTATDATLTFSGAYDGQTARTIGLNLGNANTWTALQTFPSLLIGTTTVDTLIATSTFKVPVSASSTITESGQIEIDTNDRAIHFQSGATTYSRPATSSIVLTIASSTTGSESPGFFMPYDFVVRRVLSVNWVMTGNGTTSLATTTGHDFQVWHGSRASPVSLFTGTRNTVSTSSFTIHEPTFNDNTLDQGETVWIKSHLASSSLHDLIIQLDGTIRP